VRRQLPVYSPLTLGSIARAAVKTTYGADSGAEALRDLLRSRFAADDVTLTSSGTQALQLAMASAAKPGARPATIALPGYSCYDLVSAAVGADVRIRFYDVDPRTLSPVVESFAETLERGVDAAVLGNLFGYPLDWARLRGTVEDRGVPLIEDAAQGVGTVTPDGIGGSLGAISVLSFGRGKGWTGGGGGALLRRSDLPGRTGTEQTSGRGAGAALATAVAWLLGRPTLYAIPTSIPALGLGETHYHEPTRPSEITSFSALLALETEAASSAVIPGRRAVALAWNDALRHAATLAPCEPVGGSDAASFLRCAMVAESPSVADALATRCSTAGVVRGYPKPRHRLPHAQRLTLEGQAELPGCERLASCLVALPTHGWVTPDDRARVAAIVDSIEQR